MTTDSPSMSESRLLAALALPSVESGPVAPLPASVGERLRAGLLVAAGFVLVALIALLDYGTGPYLSFGIFYLIPVAACAWWGGFAHGILLSLGGAIAWHAVECIENPMIPINAGMWNGVVRFGTLVLTSSLISRLHAGVLRERRLARTDPLTGAANGRTFYEAAAAESERARRASRSLTLAYLDLDNFKQLNDRLGHAVGDAALLHAVQTISQHLRSSDLLARLGGDEFALLLPELGAHGAIALLRRLQGLLSKEMDRKGWPVTLSIGAITFTRPTWDVDRMIQHVDALMYQAKRKGKGRVEHAVVPDAQNGPAESRRPVERRASARELCSRAAHARPHGQEAAESRTVTIRDISAGGISVCLDRQYALDTLLILEPLSPGAKVLLARVVRVNWETEGWTHGCELSSRLSADDLSSWLRADPPSDPR